MTLSMLAGPQLEPLSLEEAKLYLRVDDVAENPVIAALITTARLHIERITRRVLLEQRWRLYFDKLPASNMVEISLGPVRQIEQATCYNAEGEPQVISPNDYVVDIASVPARIKFHFKSRPCMANAINGYEIDFVAGFGPTTMDVPADLRQAVLLLVAHLYENRSAVTTDLSVTITPKGVDDLIQPYRVLSL